MLKMRARRERASGLNAQVLEVSRARISLFSHSDSAVASATKFLKRPRRRARGSPAMAAARASWQDTALVDVSAVQVKAKTSKFAKLPDADRPAAKADEVVNDPNWRLLLLLLMACFAVISMLDSGDLQLDSHDRGMYTAPPPQDSPLEEVPRVVRVPAAAASPPRLPTMLPIASTAVPAAKPPPRSPSLSPSPTMPLIPATPPLDENCVGTLLNWQQNGVSAACLQALLRRDATVESELRASIQA